ncbi:hypothetical protein [Maribacter sp. IgM3_T14_3]|uniref:hypothetical protein n=1 Tax=Maribacter sp. IgM3_T14_3 TaxID=3415140 RepID=UPI003C6F92B1
MHYHFIYGEVYRDNMENVIELDRSTADCIKNASPNMYFEKIFKKISARDKN